MKQKIEGLALLGAVFVLVLALPFAPVMSEAFSRYTLQSEEVKGNDKVCFYENARGDVYTIVVKKYKQCKRYINVN